LASILAIVWPATLKTDVLRLPAASIDAVTEPTPLGTVLNGRFRESTEASNCPVALRGRLPDRCVAVSGTLAVSKICVTNSERLCYTQRMSTTNYLDRMLQPVTEAMSPEFANKLVGLRADDELLSRIEILRGKANQGTMTVEEEAEYRDFVEAVDVLSILQAKARRVLAKPSR
jgi:hypothetical protein